MTNYTYRDRFEPCYEDCGTAGACSQFAGLPFTVTRVISEPDATHDAECLPMFDIECAGITFEAWPEEVLAS